MLSLRSLVSFVVGVVGGYLAARAWAETT